jgi:hypothetical protein
MLRVLKKKTPRSDPAVRTTLFGDMPLRTWCGAGDESEPWLSFVGARALLERNDTKGAAEVFREILKMPGLDSRHYLQAWHFLRTLGTAPEQADAGEVLGVVVEVAMPRGLDLLAVYADLSARYLNYSGAGIIWEHPDDSLDAELESLLDAGQEMAETLTLWERDKPDPPPVGQMRINILTPAGLKFTEAHMNALGSQPEASALVNVATTLIKKLMEKTRSAKTEPSAEPDA